MAIAETPVDVRFGSVDQRKYGKYLIPGQLDIAQNVIQVEEGLYEKRDGYGFLAASGGTAEDLSLVNGNLAVVDYDVSVPSKKTAKIRAAGSYTSADDFYRPFVTYQNAIADCGFRPSRLTDQLSQVWHFAGNNVVDTSTGLLQRYPRVRVVDSNGFEKLPSTVINSVQMSSGKPVRCGTKLVYVYLTDDAANSLKTAIFDTTSVTTSPTIATVHTTGTIRGFDVRSDASTGDAILMFWGSALNGGNEAIGVCRLSASTGAAGSIVFSNFSDNRAATSGGCFLNGDISGQGFLGFVSHSNVAGAGVEDIFLVSINTSTLAATTTITVSTILQVKSLEIGACLTATAASTMVLVYSYFASSLSVDAATVNTRIVTTAGVASATKKLDGAWLAAQPFLYNGRPKFIVGHETVLSTVAAPVLAPQRSYTLIDLGSQSANTPMYPAARFMYEIGGGAFDGVAGAVPGYSDHSAATTVLTGHIPPVEVSGTNVYVNLPACRDGLMDHYSVAATIDMSPTLGPPIQVGKDTIYPGGYPLMLGAWGKLMDVAPAMYPETITASATSAGSLGSFSGTFQICATYVIVTPDGREIESQPSAIKDVTTSSQYISGTVPVPGLYFKPHAAGITITDSFVKDRLFTRIYASTTNGGTLYRQLQIPINTTGQTTSYALIAAPVVGQALYTEGGVIENCPCPPFRVGMYWDDRVFVSGLSERGAVYPTKKIKPAHLPEFFFDGRFTVGDVEVKAMGAIDRQHAAIFHEKGISVINRGGPTDTGANPYEPQPLPEVEVKCDNPRSICTIPDGCVFQGTDGGIYVLTRGLEIVFIGRGVEDLATETVTGAVYLDQLQHLRLTYDNQHVVVFDLNHKPASQSSPEDSIGQWYDWPISFGSAPVGAVVQNGVHSILASDGKVWQQVDDQAYDGSSTFIPMKLRLPLTLSSVSAYLRCLRGVLLSKWVGSHKISLTLEVDGTSYSPDPVSLTTSTKRVDFRPDPSKASYFVLTIEEQQEASNLNKGFKFEGLGLVIQRQPGIARTTTRVGE